MDRGALRGLNYSDCVDNCGAWIDRTVVIRVRMRKMVPYVFDWSGESVTKCVGLVLWLGPTLNCV